MTFILNILHHDFSILVADRRAQTKGPVTLTAGKTTIKVNPAPGKNVTIDGVPKITLNKGATLAVGCAGTVGNHAEYLEKIKNEEGTNACLDAIMAAITRKWLPDRSIFLSKASFIQEQGIVTFFDPAISTYFSLFYFFCEAGGGAHWRIRVQPTVEADKGSAGALLIHAGSGSNHFEKAVGKEEIERFAASVRSGDNLEIQIKWLKDAFEKVSAIDSGVGKEVVGVISTRANPVFQTLQPM